MTLYHLIREALGWAVQADYTAQFLGEDDPLTRHDRAMAEQAKQAVERWADKRAGGDAE
jgi:hypothetical protein